MKKFFLCSLASMLCSYTYAGDPIPETIDVHKTYIQREISSIEGWYSKEKALAMFDLIIKENPKTCVEIGVCSGFSIFPTALALKLLGNGGVVFAIDPWKNEECIKNYPEEDTDFTWWSQVDLISLYKSYLKMLDKFALHSQCITCKETSTEAAKKIPSDIDILHIDGNHSEESSFLDTVTYYPKVRSGGYIWFDDVRNFLSTQKAVDYLYKYSTCVHTVDNDNCILFQKSY